MKKRDHYRLLGVTPNAGWEEIRRRFRTLAWQYHPDRNPGNSGAADRFRQILEAYEALRAARTRSRRSQPSYSKTDFSVSDELFEEIFGISRASASLIKSAGADFRYDLRIPFTGAILGMETVISVPRRLNCGPCGSTGTSPLGDSQICPDCQGRGRLPLGPGLLRRGPVCRRCQGQGKINQQPCSHCHGQGYRLKTEHYQLHIPPGTEDGARLRFVGEGGEGFQNGPPGNLEVVISVEPHDCFTRRGKDLHCRVRVSFAQAALGGLIRIPALTGHQLLNLPRGTQTGRIFRVLGAGAPAGPQSQPGDQIVEVVVTTPEHLTPAQREILEELASLEKEGQTRAAHE
ncbi:MAG: DnaJ C-terminal domain-containing protein [Thermodesulfobacteriota bacterium]